MISLSQTDKLLEIMRVVLGCVFALSTQAKFRDVPEFVAGVRRYHVVPQRLVPIAVFILMILETAAALTLITGILSDLGLVIALVLLSLFLLIAIRNIVSNTPLPCYCFTLDEDTPQPKNALLRTTMLLSLALALGSAAAFYDRNTLHSFPSLDIILMAVTMLLIITWLFRLRELVIIRQTLSPATLHLEDQMAAIGPLGDSSGSSSILKG